MAARDAAPGTGSPTPGDQVIVEVLRPTFHEAIRTSIGGGRGMIDSSIPLLAFVVANALFELRTAILVALGSAVLVVIVRLIRREPLQQVLGGVVGVGIAAYFAARTGEARGYFLPGILVQIVYSVLFLGSVLARRPLVGYVIRLFDEQVGPRPWPPRLHRVFVISTLCWAAVFALRAVVQGTLYAADSTGWLAFARLAMGWPFFVVTGGLTLLAVRRVRQQDEDAAADDAAAGGSRVVDAD